MSGFDSVDLMKRINDNLVPFRKAQTETMLGFGQMAKAAMAEGALSTKHKELIAVAIGITQHCGGCIAFHVKALHRLGCTRAEFEEAMGVCVYMGGGPGLMNVAEALAAWDGTAPAVTN
jgi:AhpD family alkylhydroperoxidase